MTYNFDPDQWFENQRLALDHRLASGEIVEDEHRAQLEELERRLEEMLRRLDGTYAIPRSSV